MQSAGGTPGAALSGASFVNSGNGGASLGMALLTGAALLCMTIGLYVLGGGATGRSAR